MGLGKVIMNREGKNKFTQSIFRTYIFCGTTILSVMLILFALNMGCGVIIKFRDVIKTNGIVINNDEDRLENIRAALVGLSRQELSILKKETWIDAWQYEPWVGFKEKPRKGKYVNVDEAGYRLTSNVPENVKYLIFMLGGSTTFGYNVADNQTIASYLQRKINEKYKYGLFGVRNYGRGYYYSEQEFILLLQLIKQGMRPAIVIFFDGLNEGHKYPYYTDEIRVLFDRNQNKHNIYSKRDRFLALIKDLPIVRAIKYVTKHFQSNNLDMGGMGTRVQKMEKFIIDDYLFSCQNIRRLCGEYGISPYFIIQPFPFYNNYRGNVFLNNEEKSNLQIWNMPRIENLRNLSREGLAIDFLDLLSTYKKQAFVDSAHYSPEVNAIIANDIFGYIQTDLDRLSRK